MSDGWNQWNEWGNHWNHTSVGNSNWEWSGISEGTDGKPIGMPDTTLIPPPAPTISSNNSTFANHCTASTAIAPVPPSLPPSFGYNPIPLSQPPFNNQVRFDIIKKFNQNSLILNIGLYVFNYSSCRFLLVVFGVVINSNMDLFQEQVYLYNHLL